MSAFMTHVWGLGALGVALNLVVGRVRMRALVAKGVMTDAQANRFCVRAALLYWVWRRGGDGTLALVAPAFSRGSVTEKTYTPRQVRLWLTALMVVAWTGFAVMRVSMPPPPPIPGCAE